MLYISGAVLGNVLAEAPERLLALSKLSRQELQEVTFFQTFQTRVARGGFFQTLRKRVARGDFFKQRVAIIANKKVTDRQYLPSIRI